MIDVLVVGAGPAGLSTAAALAKRGARVRVLDRDEAPGGVPRHSDHPGYGWRETRVLSGPAYARRLTDRASEVYKYYLREPFLINQGWAYFS